MRKGILLSAMSLILMTACTKENLTENQDTLKVTITGNSMSGFANKESRASTISHIPEDESILFYSTGGVKAEGEILKYENGQWTGLQDNKWYIDEGAADITAYYPVIKNSNELYHENGELKDVVCCKTTANHGENINLSFSHIFAKLVVNIENELNSTVKSLKINIPNKISRMELPSGNFIFDENGNGNVELDKNEEGKYEVFIPACDDMDISFDIVCEDKTSHAPIANKKYQAGFEYTCNIHKGKGIYTTSDFIAFTHLINGEQEYNGKTLEDYVTIKDGRNVYNLYSDLSFTDKESNMILRIGMNSTGFNDILDGNNHTLSNIKVISTGNSVSNIGLFETISNNGIIRNLNIINCEFNLESNLFSIGSPFIGKNNGIIDNCHIKDINIYMKGNRFYGGFVALNTGTIINSSISGLLLQSTNGNLGMFAYQNNGNIFNCRINNDANNKADTSSSNICAHNTSRLYNIFISGYNNDYYGISYSNTGHYDNCFLPDEYKSHLFYSDKESATLIKNAILYSDIEKDHSAIINELNEWIETNKSRYPDLTFRKWKTDPTEKVIFE